MKIQVLQDVKRQLQESVGTGWWLNTGISFDSSLLLPEETRQTALELLQQLGFSARKENVLNFEILLANLINTGGNKPVTISLDVQDWKITQYQRVGVSIIQMVHKLSEGGHIKMKKGYQFIRESRKTRIWATEKLLQYIPEFHSAVIFSPKELVILKDENGRLKEYRDTGETRRIRKILQRANEVNLKTDIRYGKWDLKPCLMAVFKEKFTLYGRLHTKGHRHHYQSLNEDERAEITINGDSVIELDYSGLHPHLLYAQEGIQFNEDPYTMIDQRAGENKDLRRFYKEALLSLINARGKWAPKKPKPGQKKYWRTAKTNAVGAINSLMNLDFFLPQDKRKRGLNITEKNYKDMNQARRARKYLQQGGFNKAHDIIDAFSKAHPKIAHHFYTGETGMRLMNLDSKIALAVIQHFTKQGKPILAVHDSFLVQAQYRDELFQVMQKIYQQKTGGFSIPIK